MAPVADANVFIRGRNRPFNSAYTVPEVMEELKSEQARLNFEIEDIHMMEPGEKSINKVKAKSKEISSPTSKADEKLLALALQLGEKIVTDDKALQNLASHLGVEFESFLQDEIDELREWRSVCENCGSEVSGDDCSKCGSSDIIRKPV